MWSFQDPAIFYLTWYFLKIFRGRCCKRRRRRALRRWGGKEGSELENDSDPDLDEEQPDCEPPGVVPEESDGGSVCISKPLPQGEDDRVL